MSATASAARRRRPGPWLVIHLLIEAAFVVAGVVAFALWLAHGGHRELANAGIWLFYAVAPALLIIDGWWGRSLRGRVRLEEKVDDMDEKVDVMSGAVLEVRDRLMDRAPRGRARLRVVRDDPGAH